MSRPGYWIHKSIPKASSWYLDYPILYIFLNMHIIFLLHTLRIKAVISAKFFYASSIMHLFDACLFLKIFYLHGLSFQ